MNKVQEKLRKLLNKLEPIKCAMGRCKYFSEDENDYWECKKEIKLSNGYIMYLGNWEENEIDCKWYKK